MIKILFLAANPSDTTKLQLGQEHRLIEQALDTSKFRDNFDTRQYTEVRSEDLMRFVQKHNPDVLHFSGHGSPDGSIILHDEDDQSQLISIDALRRVFRFLKRQNSNLRCVVLNACYSEMQAEAVGEEIDCVVGISNTISDKAAIIFSQVFYQALGDGKSVQDAYTQGCLQMELNKVPKKDLPKLVPSKCDPNKIIFSPTISQETKQPDGDIDIQTEETAEKIELPDGSFKESLNSFISRARQFVNTFFTNPICLWFSIALGVTLVIALFAWVTAPPPLVVELKNDCKDYKSVEGLGNAITITVKFGPDTQLYVCEAAKQFNANQSNRPFEFFYRLINNRPILVIPKMSLSGDVAKEIVDAVNDSKKISLDSADPLPTAYIPSTRAWLYLVNNRLAYDFFDIESAKPTAYSAVVIAAQDNTLKQLNAQGKSIAGWNDLADVLPSTIASQILTGTITRTIYYGHSDPARSSNALMAMVSKFLSCQEDAKETKWQDLLNILSESNINRPETKKCVKDNFERFVRHYFPQTTGNKDILDPDNTGNPEQGSQFLDFAPVQERDVIAVNCSDDVSGWRKKVEAIYPSEGIFVNDHPFAIIHYSKAGWVDEEQYNAAEKFRDFVLTKDIQKIVLNKSNMRPIKEAGLTLEGSKFANKNCGVEPDALTKYTELNIPRETGGKILQTIQDEWPNVKKKADIWLVLDASGSMKDLITVENESKSKWEAVVTTIKSFLENISSHGDIRLGVIIFAKEPATVMELNSIESNTDYSEELDRALNITPDKNTALYDAVVYAIKQANESNLDKQDKYIRGIVVLSDGADNQSSIEKEDMFAEIERACTDSQKPLDVIPVPFTDDPDHLKLLGDMGKKCGITVSEPDDENSFQKIFEEVLKGYF